MVTSANMAKKSGSAVASRQSKKGPVALSKPAAPRARVILFADPAKDARPICLPCVARQLATITDPTEREAWQREEQIARATWASLRAAGKPLRVAVSESEGWLYLMLTRRKWKHVTKKRLRCWDCCHRFAIAYRLLVEEQRGAPLARVYAQQCKEAAEAAALLALEIEATDYRPTGLACDGHDLRGDLKELIHRHIATLRAVNTAPSEPLSWVVWTRLDQRLAAIAEQIAADSSVAHIRYDPLTVGPEFVRAVAVALRKTSLLGSFTHHGFAGVVAEHTKDPYNPPQTLALVKAYQWAQELAPPMGYRELARVLIEHGVADPVWGGDIVDLANSIKGAVRSHKSDGEIQSQTFAPPKVVSPPLQNR